VKELNDKLTELKANLREKERLTSMLERIREEKNDVENRKRELQEELRKEEKDVEKLEGISLSNFIHTIRGNKDERLHKEKSEYITAKLKFDTISSELDSLNREKEGLQRRILDIGDLNQQYTELIKEKERILSNSSEAFRDKLEDLSETESSFMSKKKEILEAIGAGNELLRSLNQVQSSLDSAGNWGTWDIFGGGMISTMAKHSRIDEAQREINNAQFLIKKFHRELSDIGGEMNLTIDIGSFLTFADYFFDGLFADLTVQSRIRDGQSRVDDAIVKVERIMRNLSKELDGTEREVERIKKERLVLIENA